VSWTKIIQFSLKNWKEILIVVSLLSVAIKSHMDYRALNKAYETSKEEMQLQITSLKEIHAEEIRQREQALQTYRNALREIEQNYLESQEELEKEKQKKTNNYVIQYSQDQEGLANEIVNAYGFKLVE
tara:strand:- start:185 stop:568 length:384 start_codon:yes stop_codon:yes gene_type:complete